MSPSNETDVVARRRHKLKAWIDANFKGVQAAFVEKIGINQGELSGLLKTKSFGEKKARALESQAGMPPYWLDTDSHESVVPEPLSVLKHADLIAAWDLLLPGEQADLMEDIKRRAAHNKAVMEMHAAKVIQEPTETEFHTVRVSDRRTGTRWFGHPERRAKEHKNGEK